MTLKSLSVLSIMMAAASSAYAYQQYPVKLQNPPETSKVTQTYDESTGIYNIHVDENTFGSDDIRPTIRFEKSAEVLPEYAKTLAFEYKSTKACGEQKFVCYNMMTTGKFTRKFPFYTRMEISDEWQTYRIAVGDLRGKPNYYGDKVGQYQDLIFMDFVTGTDLQIRNIRYEDEEVPFVPLTITAGKATSIEAENFNISAAEGLSYGSNPTPLANTPYIDPTPGLFPIYAFTSVSYVGVNVSDDFMENMRATAELLNKKYRDMEAAGFTITEGGAYPAIDRCFLFDGLTEFNGYQANLHDGVKNLKMIIRNGVDDSDVIRRAMSSDRLAGYAIKDEPFAHDMDGVKTKSERVLGIDDSHLLYGNLININYPAADLGFKSYDEYMRKFIEHGKIGVLSFDYYPVRNHSQTDEPNEENTILMPNYYQNLEIASKLSRYYDKPWWGFIRSMSSGWKNNPPSVYMGSFRYPEPKEDQMRVQAFSNLAYGAQGIEYWPYACCDGTFDAPCADDGSLNPSYYYAKAINTEIHALSWVFLGAKLIKAAHTNAETPVGCLRLTKALMPDGVTDVKTSGKGMPVTTLQNGKYLFMMAVNPDIWHNQEITVTLDKAVKRVLSDGTTENVAAGTYTYDLPVGGYLIYLVNENTPEYINYASPAPVCENYRADVSNVAFTSAATASNGYYISGMGNNSWTNYSKLTPENETRAITREQAIENWGAYYAYTFDVAEDMTVDISIGHSVPWSEYGRVAATGAMPGVSYTIENEPELNWPKQYAASMTLSLDGETLTPDHAIRPVAPDNFDETGAEFNAILADKSRWTPTDGDENLYFWPKAGGDNDVTPRYNDAPDYRGVTLTAGTHRIVVKSNSFPWNFDNILIAPADMSGIDNIAGDNAASFKATAVSGGILVETEGDFTVYNLGGVAAANGRGSKVVDLAAGLYIVVADKTSVKVFVK